MGYVEDQALKTRNRRGRRRDKPQGPASWIEGFNLRLTADEKEKVKDNLAEEDLDMATLLDELAQAGLKTSMSYNRKTNSYMVTIFRNDPEWEDAGYTLTARANSFDRCLAALLFALKDVNDFNIQEVAHIRSLAEPEF